MHLAAIGLRTDTDQVRPPPLYGPYLGRYLSSSSPYLCPYLGQRPGPSVCPRAPFALSRIGTIPCCPPLNPRFLWKP